MNAAAGPGKNDTGRMIGLVGWWFKDRNLHESHVPIHYYEGVLLASFNHHRNNNNSREGISLQIKRFFFKCRHKGRRMDVFSFPGFFTASPTGQCQSVSLSVAIADKGRATNVNHHYYSQVVEV